MRNYAGLRADDAVSLDSVASRNIVMLRELARDIIRRGPGARLATTAQYQERLKAGSGTVQKALRDLSRLGAVELRSRGHQGTFLVDSDLSLLWAVASLGPLRLVLTPPGALDGYGLVRGLSEELGRLGVPLEFSYARGGAERVRWVEERRASVAAVSAGAAEALLSGNDRLDGLDLGPDTYYSEDSIGVLRRADATVTEPQRTRVGIDSRSPDHVALTHAEFPTTAGYSYVECDFVGMPAAVLERKVDVGVWHRLLLVIPLHIVGVSFQPLTQPAARALRRGLSSAVLVHRRDSEEVAGALRQIDISAVRSTQRALLELESDPAAIESAIWAR
jgi:hypothetical protein